MPTKTFFKINPHTNKKERGKGDFLKEEEGLISEYEEVLCGKKNGFSSSYIKKNTSEKEVIRVLDYAFRMILGWTPEMVRDYLTPEVIDGIKLERIIKKIDFPPEHNAKRDFYYYAHVVYPDTIKIDKKELVLAVYRRILDGEQPKFPKNFFVTAKSEDNLSICMEYAVNVFAGEDSVTKLYGRFADRNWAHNFFEVSRLDVPLEEYYQYPIDMFHDCLPDEEKDELLYQYGRFKTESDTIRYGGYYANKRAR